MQGPGRGYRLDSRVGTHAGKAFPLSETIIETENMGRGESAVYFAESGPVNSVPTVKEALRVARERGIGHILVPSVTGESALLLAEQTDCRVICITHVYGFVENGVNQMPTAVREKLRAKSVELLTATHVLSGVERGMSGLKGGMYPAEIMSNTLRMFGQGLKVCVEIAIMALDAGLIPYGEDVIALGGTNRGVDTAVIVKPAHANKVFETMIREVICKPY